MAMMEKPPELNNVEVYDPARRKLMAENVRLRQLLAQAQDDQQRLAQKVALLRARLQVLSPWDPRDQVRLLWWVLVRPDKLRDYRAYLGDWGEIKLAHHAGWVIASLLWLPVLLWLLVPWALGVLPMSAAAGLLLTLGIGFGWVVTGLLASHDNALSALAGVMTTTILLLVVIALVGGLAVVVDETATAVSILLPLGVAALMAAMAAVTTAVVLKLKVGEVLAGVTAVLVGSGSLIVMWQQTEFSTGAVALMLFAIAMAGFIEDRHSDPPRAAEE